MPSVVHPRRAVCLLMMGLLSLGTALGAIKNVKDAPYSAVGNGIADDRPAFASALASLAAGDILLVPPGTYRIVLTGSTLSVPNGASILGQDGQAIISLENNGSTAYREFLRPGGSNVTIEGLTIKRNADFPAVLFPIMGSSNPANYVMRNCTIVGNKDLYPTYYCHAMQIGNNTVTNVLIDGCTFTTCSYGLLQNSSSTGTVNGFTVQNCHFEKNYSTDLEFNSPNATVSNVLVTDCYFRNNQANTTAAGWAVGFANIQTGTVKNCSITQYNSAGIHVEDDSSNITLTGNQLITTAVTNSDPVIILSGSNGVSVDNNLIDARGTSRVYYLILATAGSTTAACPTNVSVTNNVLINTASSKTWYLQTGSTTTTPSGNIIGQ